MDAKEAAFTEWLTGQKVVGITFVQDYLQIQLDDATLNLLWPPQLVAGGSTYRLSDAGFPHAARRLLNLRVLGCHSTEEAFGITFSDGSTLHVSYDQDDAEGPEAIPISSKDGSFWVAP